MAALGCASAESFNSSALIRSITLMADPWINNVRKTKQLTVFASPNVTGGTWNNIFLAALVEFNKLSTSMNLGVTMTQAFEAPETNGLGGADVKFDAASGTVSETALGKPFSVEVIGTETIGITKVVRVPGKDNVERIVKAFVIVPLMPMFFIGPAGQQIRREVGKGVKTFIAVHEFIHACGLSDPEHSPPAIPDVFVGQPDPSPGAPNKPDDDRLVLRKSPVVKAPPILISTRTANLIKPLWEAP